MRKNNYLIEQAKHLEKQKKAFEEMAARNIAEIYSCIAKALYDKYGWDGDKIEELFVLTQQMWEENADSMDKMIDWVAETTGIEVRSI
jgi:hypothetical protein